MDPSHIAMVLRKLLEQDPAFSDVDHARFQETDDEESWQPNAVRFIYRERPYHAQVESDGKILISRPVRFGGIRPIGEHLTVDSRTLARDIAQAIDSHVRE